MSKLVRSIKECMSNLSSNRNGLLSADFTFAEDFLGFKGHFPGKPILPGVCKIQAAMLMLKESRKKNFVLKEIMLAKFFSPVLCNERISFSIKEEEGPNEEILVKVEVTGKGKKIAELHLRIAQAS
jgi:3-hydroxyacyl-[acyl-carrier-protein] dehydratase